MLEKIKHFLITIILKQKSTSDRAKGGELSPSTQCIPHLPMVGQKRSCRGTFELKTNSKWQFAIWYIETLCTPTLKLAETNTASQKSSLPSFSPQNTLPLFPDCFNMNSEAKQSTDPGQTPAFFFFFFQEVSFNIHYASELDRYANVCRSSRRKMAQGQKWTARAWKGQNHFIQRQH